MLERIQCEKVIVLGEDDKGFEGLEKEEGS
jgi:hypothetical protein